MDCNDVQDRLEAFVDDELAIDEAEKIRQHIPNCTRCMSTVAQHEAAESLLSYYRIEGPPESLKRSIMHDVTSRTNDGTTMDNSGGFYQQLSYAAVLVVGILLGLALRFWAISPQRTSTRSASVIGKQNRSIEVMSVQPTGSLLNLVSQPSEPSTGGKL